MTSPLDPHSSSNDSPSPNQANGGSEGNSQANGNGVLATVENRTLSVPALGWPYGPPPRPEILSSKATPFELFHALRRRLVLALGLGFLVGGVAAGLLWFFLPVKTEAYATLKVSGKTPSVLEKETGGGEEFTLFKRTQVQLILSNMVLQRTVAEPEINHLSMIQEHNDDPIGWLKEQLMIDYPGDSELMRIAIKAKVPSEAVKLVNKVVEKYISEIVHRELEVRLKYQAELEKNYNTMVANYERELKALNDLEMLHKSSGTESAQLGKKLAMDLLNDLVYQRSRVVDQISANRMSIALMEARRDHPEDHRPPESLVEVEVNRDPVIVQWSQRLSQYSEHLAELTSQTTNPESNYKIKRLRDAMQRLEDIIEERRSTLRPQLMEAQMASALTGVGEKLGQMNLPLLQTQQEYLDARFTKLEEAVAKQTEKVESLRNFSEEVANKQETVQALKHIKNELGGQLDRIKVERFAQERIIKIDDAVLGNSDAVRKYLGVVFSFVLGFGAVMVAVAFLEFQTRKINSVHDVKDGLGIRVVGELPGVSAKIWRRMKKGRGPGVLKALIAERIDGTRTALIHTTVIDPPRLVMITSAEPHEGKTTTASQLAASLARSGRRTLLVDADIRNPAAHRVFDLPLEPGLCELLRGETEREAVVHPTLTANLWLLPAGRCDLNSVKALSTPYLGTLIAALGVEFDYLVFDSGPVLKIADPLMVGQHVDAAIVSVMRDVSKVPQVYEACERLRSVGITVLGAVVNGVNDDIARHGVELLMAETTHAEKSSTS